MSVSQVFAGQAPDANRVFFTEVWFRGHNNPRYSELLPRLGRLDAYLPTCAEQRIVRGIQFRALRATEHTRYRVLFSAVRRRYQSLFTVDPKQIAHFDGPVFADVDDPTFDERDIELMKSPNLTGFTVTNERMGRCFEALGVDKPWHVIPQGASLASIDHEKVAEVARRHRSDGEVVVGYMAAWLLSKDDRHGDNLLLNVDHLLDLWDEINPRVPQARLWLLGGASNRIRARCEGRDDIVVFGRLPRDEVLAYASNFDIALYPRAADINFQVAKIAEYLGCGLPTVAYDYEVTADLRDSGAGLMASTPHEFVAAVERLAADTNLREQLAGAARKAGAARDWDVLGREYEALLDRYL